MEQTELQLLTKNKQSEPYKVKAGIVGFDVKDVDMTKREVRVVLNTFNFLDSDGDVLLPGSAKVSIRERGPASSAVAKIKYAKDHDLTKIPGSFTELEEGEFNWRGQAMKALMGTVKMGTTTLGNDQLIDYQEGRIDNHSIGFQYMNLMMIERGSNQWSKFADDLINPEKLDGRSVFWVAKEINLFEGSSVAFGANSLTPSLGLKTANKDGLILKISDRIDKLKWCLQNGTVSDERMQTFELQLKQLQQFFIELVPEMNLDKLRAEAMKNETPEIQTGYDFASLTKKFTL